MNHDTVGTWVKVGRLDAQGIKDYSGDAAALLRDPRTLRALLKLLDEYAVRSDVSDDERTTIRQTRATVVWRLQALES